MIKIKCPYCDFVAVGETMERAEQMLLIHIDLRHRYGGGKNYK
jgi:hypothetical protein